MKDITLDRILQDFATDLYHAIIFQLEQPYIAANGKTYKGLNQTSALVNSVKVFVDADAGIEVIANDYFINIDKGRRPRVKRVPFNIIFKWIKEKGIIPRSSNGQFKSMTRNQLAWVIQKSIYKNGIRARNIIDKVLLDIYHLYKDNLEVNIDKLIDQLIINFNNDVIKTEGALFTIKKRTISK